MNLLLDTTVLIDVLRSRNSRRQLLAALLRDGHTLSTTAMNIAEVYSGIRKGEEEETEVFIGSLFTFDLRSHEARAAGRLKSAWAKKGKTLGLADAIVASVAIENGCALVTDNRKDFPMPELKLFPLP